MLGRINFFCVFEIIYKRRKPVVFLRNARYTYMNPSGWRKPRGIDFTRIVMAYTD